jgi:hypothetical protein
MKGRVSQTNCVDMRVGSVAVGVKSYRSIFYFFLSVTRLCHIRVVTIISFIFFWSPLLFASEMMTVLIGYFMPDLSIYARTLTPIVTFR